MRGRRLFVILGALLFSHLAQAQKLQTDLGPTGNKYAAARFAKYQQKGFVCAAPQEGVKRILLAGFGPFLGGEENASGLVLQNMAGFSPPQEDVDVFGVTRELKINNQNYQVCFLVTSVMWDISAAILVSEAEQFQPQFILMSGLGSENRALFESGNSNRARFLGGFDINGKPAPDNEPQDNYVLPPTDTNVPFISKLTWDAPRLSQLVAQDIKALGFDAYVPEPGYASNDYLCNNVAFVLTHASHNFKVELAGGMIALRPQFLLPLKVGFLHYPYDIKTNKISLDQWGQIVLKIISN